MTSGRGSGQVRLMGTGLVLTILIGALSGALWGRNGAVPSVVLGVLAIGIQLVAHRLLQRPTNPKSPFPAGWLWGAALRVAGIGAMLLLVLMDRETFAPLPAAMGYVGVLVPLLMLELKTT